MLIHPQIDPVALQIGPLAVHWYGLTYLAAFGLFVLLGRMRLQHPTDRALLPDWVLTSGDVEALLFGVRLRVVQGGLSGCFTCFEPAMYDS